jgi:hypothetical protein
VGYGGEVDLGARWCRALGERPALGRVWIAHGYVFIAPGGLEDD